MTGQWQVSLLAISSQARAWDVRVEGPDVFGLTKVLGGTTNGRETLVVQCNSEDELFLALIFPKKEFEEIPTLPAKFFLQTDSEKPQVLDAVLRTWNDKNAGIVMSGRSEDIISAIKGMGTAKSRVNVGYELSGMRESASFGARGSTKTIDRIVKDCKLS
jgi:hypothetical protein